MKKQKIAPLKWKLFVVFLTVILPICFGVYLYMTPRPVPAANLISIRGSVMQLLNETETPVFNITVIALSDVEGVKGFTNETGQYEIWVGYPQNLSAPIFICVMNGTSEVAWRNQTLPDVVICIEATETYTVWGFVDFEPIVLKEQTEYG